MDRIELQEAIWEEAQQSLVPLKLSPDRFSRQKKDWMPSTQDQALAGEIYEYFGHQIEFEAILFGYIKNKGYEATFRNFKTCKTGYSPKGLFKYLMSKEVVIWK